MNGIDIFAISSWKDQDLIPRNGDLRRFVDEAIRGLLGPITLSCCLRINIDFHDNCLLLT
ncbi:hypothetical protein FD38_GL001565 [Levilactobacillus zymae DSM 19395]|nr:hypothetical protein FD38_GL001565 [Levilactobacillus zymae DSM 19395]